MNQVLNCKVCGEILPTAKEELKRHLVTCARALKYKGDTPMCGICGMTFHRGLAGFGRHLASAHFGLKQKPRKQLVKKHARRKKITKTTKTTNYMPPDVVELKLPQILESVDTRFKTALKSLIKEVILEGLEHK